MRLKKSGIIGAASQRNGISCLEVNRCDAIASIFAYSPAISGKIWKSAPMGSYQ
ncbi:MAG: hypothetical protein KME52_01590 [Desmonostoc geniculatum HA4340-LM1]|nr:hypothetical protein [Desmonostoc geniculatum HA4340-LM1]